MEYALLDWDNTLRRNYTLFSWIDFLIREGTINERVQEKIDVYLKRYSAGKLTHDNLAQKCCDVFSAELKGMDKKIIDRMMMRYMSEDKEHIFPFTESIFYILNKHNIKPIIVSGAPLGIIQNYCDEFNIYKIYAFLPEEIEGRFTGKVHCNFGYDKRKQVEKICNEIGTIPRIAFGDSISDLEMLRMAQKSIIVCKNESQAAFKTDGIIEHNTTVEKVKLMIEEILN